VDGSGSGTGPGERRGGGEHADTGGDARVAAGADRVAAAVAELYGGEPEAFTERRKALAALAKSAGDRDAASAIAALRKPTRAAWVVNRLARAEPDASGRLAALAAALRAAEQGKDGPRLRELSAERGALIDALTGQALAAAGVAEPPSGLRDEVADTLTAAFADPGTAAEFAAGTLTRAAHWSGFGAFDLASADGASAERAVSVGGGARPGPTRLGRPSRSSGSPKQTGGPPDEVGARRVAQERRAAEEGRAAQERLAQERRAAEQQEQLAREAAEREAVRRKNYEDMERTVVSAATATAEAEAAEDRLEAEVRDLEGRLTKARDDLAAARRHARHAEAAERRARQTLDRLPRP
jgi:hypothetical protein